jgi:Glycosyl transferase family 2
MPRFLAPEPPPDLAAAGPPEFSIIVPAYEAAGTVGEAVESALAQTYPAREIVICDDGSRDDLAAALDDFGDRVILIRQENAGPAAARNAAARRASGEFVANLDADDVLLPGNLEARAELLTARPDLDIVGSDGFVEVDGNVVRHLYRDDWRFETGDQRAAILERCFIAMHWAVRRSRLLEVGGFDPAISHGEDWECFIRLILSGSRAGMVDEPLARYRLQPGSLSSQAVESGADRLAIFEKTLGRDDLSDRERSLLAAKLEAARLELRLAQARETLLVGGPGSRDAARRLLFERRLPVGIRLRAALAWMAPKLARKLLRRRGTTTGAGVVLPIE